MSACRYSELFGNDLATCSPASTDEDELTTTLAPSSLNRRAIASPIPEDEPVTIATFPANSRFETVSMFVSMSMSGLCRGFLFGLLN